MTVTQPDLDTLDAQALREFAAGLMKQVEDLRGEVTAKSQELVYRQTRIDQLTHEMAVLKRYQFGKRSEQLDSTQASLLDESIDADIAAIEEELAQLSTKSAASADAPQKLKRARLPASLPRTVIHHEPESTLCGCGCMMKMIGEDVAEKLDYIPGVFTVEQHVRGKWVCGKCETLIQAPVPAHVIDKGIPTAGLLAQVLVVKFMDHLPLYGRRKSLPAPGWPCRARRWANGSAYAACVCSRWSTRCAPNCLATMCYTLTRRRCKCSIRARR